MSTESQRASQALVAKHLRVEANKEFEKWWTRNGINPRTISEELIKAACQDSWLASRGVEE